MTRWLLVAALAAGCAGPKPAVVHPVEGGTIASHTNCAKADDVPLDVLTNHLLFGLEHRLERSRRQLTLAGRAALRTRLDATLDGVLVALDVVVLRKDGCTHDMVLIAPPDRIARLEPEFEHFLGRFEAKR
jgi:hypothetical protein